MKKIVKLWKTNFINKNITHYDLKKYLKDTELWIAAYMKISKNKGSNTPGPDNKTLDGMTITKLENLKNEVINKTFK